MNALLVHARFPTTYWGFQYSLRFVAKRTSLPPLGLMTLAALLPEGWSLRLVDLNLRRLSQRDLRWADAVLVSGMLVQSESMRQVVERARAAGCRTVVGGPAPTTAPELFATADVIFQGEAEGRVGDLVAALERPASWPTLLAPSADSHPSLDSPVVPRFDLLEVGRYASMSLQFSRGCPFSCEFCDVIEIFGRVPRVKPTRQVLAELDAVHRTGFRGTLFFVDDNFIGNRRSVRELLPALRGWQERNGWPFELYTEASVDLAADPQLTRAMVDAGFASVFVGIETPSREALADVGKRQNLGLDLADAVDRLTRSGLEVMGGFIVGFDRDDPGVFQAQRALIDSLPVPLAMVGLLSALPGTALWRRLKREGRLRTAPGGDQFCRPNFEPSMDEEELLRGYAELLRDLYSADSYYSRCSHYLLRAGAIPPGSMPRGADLAAFLRAVVLVGIIGARRRHFWRLLRQGARLGSAALRQAVVHAIKGEHMIRYTRDHVLPRIAAAVEEVARQRLAHSTFASRHGSA